MDVLLSVLLVHICLIIGFGVWFPFMFGSRWVFALEPGVSCFASSCSVVVVVAVGFWFCFLLVVALVFEAPDIGNSSCPKRKGRVSRLSTLHSPQENRVRTCQPIPKV